MSDVRVGAYGPIAILWMAIRPKTLWAAFGPTIAAISYSFSFSTPKPLLALSVLLTAFLLQILSNLVNDYFDFVRGVDGESRSGPIRVSSSELVRPEKMRELILGTMVLTCLSGLYIVLESGPEILILGLLALLAASLYSAGPIPFSAIGLGEVVVFLFFGPVAFAGALYVLAGAVPRLWVFPSSGFGLFCAVILLINNIRDREPDQRAGRTTLAVLLGDKRSRILCGMLVWLGFACLLGFWFSEGLRMLPVLFLIIPVKALGDVILYSPLSDLNQGLESAAKLVGLSGMLFGISCFL